MFLIVLVLVLLLVLSGFFSSMETSLATLNKAKIKALFSSSKLRLFKDWLTSPGSVFSTILIGNNLVNIAFSSVLSYVIIERFLAAGFSTAIASFIALAATSALLLFFGEIMPKNIATTYPRKVSETFGGLLNLAGVIFKPAAKITTYVSDILTGEARRFGDVRISRGDIGELSETLEDKDSFSKIITQVLSLSNKKISEIMTPRSRIIGIDLNLPGDRIKEKIIDSGISRFPAYYGEPNNIAGIIYTREMVKALILKGNIDFRKYIHLPVFIEQNTTALSAYRKFIRTRVHIAMVTDSNCDVTGIITMEDLLEEVFGDILDEYDLKPGEGKGK